MVEMADKSGISSQNISYYDEIANSYDEILSTENSNALVRQKVKEKFTTLVRSGWVLDFGGGTGLDLGWLTQGYNIVFCEPSDHMRARAINWRNNNSDSNKIIFIDKEQTDFSIWHKNLPFPQKLDGALANFGVINCIPDISSLFNALALVMKPGAPLVVVFLGRTIKNMWKWHRLNAIRSMILGVPFIRYVYHNRHRQTVFVHSLKEIRKGASSRFKYVSHERLDESGFILMHLWKK
jgi:SAM-dependent methyltransferase